MALRSVVSMLLYRHSSGVLVNKICYSSPVNSNYIFKAQCYTVSRFFQLSTITKANASQLNGFDESKAKLVSSLNFKSTADALPFYKLPITTLIHIQKTVKNDVAKGYCKNRLYYISSRLKVPPSVLSAKLAKRTFVYSLSFEWIEKALDVLLEMSVSSNRILRDLWVLKYHHETIRERLQLVKDSGVDKLCPWMVRCTDDILKRFISISQETKDILGETKTTKTYLANRLGTSIDDIEEICLRLPAFKTIRVTKVKKFLDFLLNEGFNTEDIRNKPRVLSASQKTVKQRIEKLRLLGVSEINLNVLCRSKKDFKKYCDSVESISKETKTPNSTIKYEDKCEM